MSFDVEEAVRDALVLRGSVSPLEAVILRADLQMQSDYQGEFVAFVDVIDIHDAQHPTAQRMIVVHSADIAEFQRLLQTPGLLEQAGVDRDQLRVTRCA
jgi:hypothetical protein